MTNTGNSSTLMNTVSTRRSARSRLQASVTRSNSSADTQKQQSQWYRSHSPMLNDGYFGSESSIMELNKYNNSAKVSSSTNAEPSKNSSNPQVNAQIISSTDNSNNLVAPPLPVSLPVPRMNPESNRSQHSSIGSGSTSTPCIVRESRTTTSRRGGRPSRSRSPLAFASRSSSSTTIPTSNTSMHHSASRGSGSLSPSPLQQVVSASNVKISPSSNANVNTNAGTGNPSFSLSVPIKEEIRSGNNISIIAQEQCEKHKETTETNGDGKDIDSRQKYEKSLTVLTKASRSNDAHVTVSPSKAPSSVAKKAAAEAQRWFHAREHASYGRSYYDGSIDPKYYHHYHGPRAYYSGGYVPYGPMDGGKRKHVKEGNYPSTHQYDRQNVFRLPPPMAPSPRPMVQNEDSHHQRIATRTKNKVNKPTTTTNATTHVMGSLTPMKGCNPGTNKNGDLTTKEFSSPKAASGKNDSTSIFRFDEIAAPPGSPQRMLLEMKSGSKSFDLKSPLPSPTSSTIKAGAPLSPQEPPQIQHAHQQINTNSFFFEPQKSPRTPKTPKSPRNNVLFGTPSFNLFNHDFDSFDESDNLNLPTPNQNTLSLLENDIRSPTLFLSESSPKKLVMSSPCLEGIDVAFSLKKKEQMNNKPSKEMELDIEGAPPMPQVISTGKDENEKRNRAAIAYKSVPSTPLKKRILKENRTPLHIHDQSMNEQKKDGSSEKKVPASQTRQLHKYSPHHRRQYSQMHRYRPMPPSNGHIIHPYPYQFPPPPKMRYSSVPSLSRMETTYFYQILGSHKEAFERFSFLLPGLKAIITGVPRMEKVENEKQHSNKPTNLEIARKRVVSAVCAFGGNYNASQATNIQSIFRAKQEESENDVITKKSIYEERLPKRFYENENRISWEAEENPPVDTSALLDSSNKRKSPTPTNVPLQLQSTPSKKSKLLSLADDRSICSTPGNGDQQKMRYRCKLCGQPKQNHVCQYQQSLQRSIGVMVYSAVNSYTASEPGHLAPGLTDMNNFIQSSDNMFAPENTPSRSSPKRDMMTKPLQDPTTTPMRLDARQVTPENMRYNHSRFSPDSIHSMQNLKAHHTPYSRHRQYAPYPRSCTTRAKAIMSIIPRQSILSPVPRPVVSKNPLPNRLFVERSELRPEQYRTVSVSNDSPAAYKYPSLPLPYGQRKGLSGNLFSLSKEVPQLADECASVLRQARQEDKWDLAVAELLTQIMVVVYCPKEDVRLDGLSRYLLSLGFSC